MFRRFFSDIAQSKYIIKNLVNQNLTVKYKRSILGLFWSVLNPLFNILVCSLVFGSILRFDLQQFVVFLYAGMLPWGFFAQSIASCSSSILNAEGFIKKIYIPKVVFPISNICTIFINTLFSFTALFLVVLIVGAKVYWSFLFLPVSFLIVFMLVVGVSLLTATSTVYFRDTPYLIDVVVNVWYYLTPILYPLESIPENLRVVFIMNPMYYVIQLFRYPIYIGTLPDAKSLIVSVGFAVTMFVLGLYVFYKKEKDFIFRL